MKISNRLDRDLARDIERRCGTTVHASYLDTAQYFAKDKFLFMTVGNDGFLAGSFGKKHFRLYAIAVDENLQSKGIGRKMMRRLIKICKAKGLEKITLRTSAEETAHEFYKKFGAVVTGLHDGDYEMEIRI